MIRTECTTLWNSLEVSWYLLLPQSVKKWQFKPWLPWQPTNTSVRVYIGSYIHHFPRYCGLQLLIIFIECIHVGVKYPLDLYVHIGDIWGHLKVMKGQHYEFCFFISSHMCWLYGFAGHREAAGHWPTKSLHAYLLVIAIPQELLIGFQPNFVGTFLWKCSFAQREMIDLDLLFK